MMTRTVFRHRLRGGAIVAGFAVAALTLTSCGTTADTDSGTSSPATDDGTVDTIVFDYPFTALPIYEVLTTQAQAYAEEKGVTLEVTNDNMDLSTQVSNLNTWLAKAPDAIVSFPMDTASIDSIAKSFIDQGTTWVTYGGDLDNQDASLQFSFYDSGYMLGRDAGEWANENLDGTGKALLLIDQTIQLGQERTQGIIDGLSETAPDVEIIAEQQGITPEEGLSITTSTLSQDPDVNIVLAAAGDAAQGAYQALVSSGRAVDDADTYVGGLDGNLSLLQAMKRGEFVRAVTTIDPAEIAHAAIDVPLAAAAGEMDPGEVYNVDVDLVTHDYAGLDDLITSFGG